MEAIYHAEGRVSLDNGQSLYEYNLTDHLGNLRLSFADRNGDGDVDITSDPGTNEVLQEHHYYPFGMALEGDWVNNPVKGNRYRYNGKELEDDFGLNWYAYGARYYDPAIGRFTGVDLIADEFAWVTPYNYAENEPIANIDLWGLQKFNVTARAFIPQKTVANPNPFSPIKRFAGDNRTEYNVNSTSYRVEQSVILDFDNSDYTINSNVAAETIGLDGEGNIVKTSKRAPGGKVKASLNDGVGRINFDIDAGNKLSSAEVGIMTPNINMSGLLELVPAEDGGFNFSLDISTDGFPAYEIFVTDEEGNSTLIFGRNPVESGEGPGSLFPPAEHSFKINGNNATSPQGPVIDFEDKKNPK